MNLVKDLWIPTPEGLVSLSGISEETPNIEGGPDTVVPLLRFLIALATRALELSGEDWDTGSDIAEAYQAGTLKEALNKYLKENYHLFELHDKDRPFLQTPASVFPKHPKNVYTLRRMSPTDAAAGNGYKLDTQITDMSDPATQAQLILSLQIFAPGYKKGKGSSAYGEEVQILNVPSSPFLVYGQGMAAKGIQHLMLWGKNMLETIMLNMFCKEHLEEFFVDGLGTPIWEKDASKTDPSLNASVTQYYDYMVPAYHKYVRIEGDSLIYAGAAQIQTPHGIALYHILDQRTYKDKETKQEVTVSEYHRTPIKNLFWREMGAFLGVLHSTALARLLEESKLESYRQITIRSMGVGQVKEGMGLYQLGEVEDSTVTIKLDKSEARTQKLMYARGCALAHRSVAKLGKNLWHYAKATGADQGKVKDKVARVYWQLLSDKKHLLQEDLRKWSKAIKASMLDAANTLPAQSIREIQEKSKLMSNIHRSKV